MEDSKNNVDPKVASVLNLLQQLAEAILPLNQLQSAYSEAFQSTPAESLPHAVALICRHVLKNFDNTKVRAAAFCALAHLYFTAWRQFTYEDSDFPQGFKPRRIQDALYPTCCAVILYSCAYQIDPTCDHALKGLRDLIITGRLDNSLILKGIEPKSLPLELSKYKKDEKLLILSRKRLAINPQNTDALATLVYYLLEGQQSPQSCDFPQQAMPKGIAAQKTALLRYYLV